LEANLYPLPGLRSPGTPGASEQPIRLAISQPTEREEPLTLPAELCYPPAPLDAIQKTSFPIV